MSLTLVAQVLGMDLESCPRKMVLIKLADNANDKGLCWPSYEHLAKHCNVSRRTAMRHIDDLVLTGYVQRFWRKDGEHGNRSNYFKLTLGNGDISTLAMRRLEAENNKRKDNSPLVSESPTLVPESQPLVSECQNERTESQNNRSESHPELVNEPVNELVINNILSNSTDLPPKKHTKKPKFIREIFNLYPAHRRGGTDQLLWKTWKQEKLTEHDALNILDWLTRAAQSDPQWGTNANGQFVNGIIKFIRERKWLTPIPVIQQAASNALDMDDMTWAEDLNEGVL
ncbi:helix-turn-helix domain-containing protein [Psychromonas sp. PT13]|uniref:helix-turn-helix domain-containing protein n=1 Tax=Psychromonas sp. PT13 TaxID=3439547 RepID=UPI003EBF6C64